jgi:hypothetical protein
MNLDLWISKGVPSARPYHYFLGSVGMTVIVFWLLLLFPASSNAQSTSISTTWFTLTGCMERLFKVTAYYTPEATQWVFFNGDYATERKINWGNRHGASGKHVYNGMLAGPKKYPFTTTVNLPGHGFGAIYDRWSAIIATGEYDRLDIRAGAGLQGMVNALRWGTKTLTGTICSWWLDNSTHWFDRSNYPLRGKASRQMIWTLNMEQGNKWLTVHYLNSFLEQLWYLKLLETKPITWDENRINNKWNNQKQYRSLSSQKADFTTGTKLALCAFQQDNLWLSADNEYCGYYGTNTRRSFANLVKNWIVKLPESQSLTEQIQTVVKKIKKKKILKA